MAISSFGVSGFGEFGLSSDSDQDANSALMELDKGLRSGKLGEQCEAIVKFPRLFEKYPFPILINSAFLKLADVFRVGTNFLRLWVLRVTQQSEKHLDKILNIDEFLRRIYMVIHSNDPVARAVTLRTLGSIALIIPERKNAHHSILNGLDSHDSVELEAAIFAAAHFAAQSKTFCDSICGKLADKIKGLETPMETKLKLIEIFQHMHHDIHTATKVRDLCIQLLPSYPAKNFVMTTLVTLTKLATHTLVDIPDQTALLLQYLTEDLRTCVKVQALKSLKTLGSVGPHLWTESYITILVDFCSLTPSTNLKYGCLEVLSTLSCTAAVTCFTGHQGSSILKQLMTLCYHGNLDIASKASQILTDVCVHNIEQSQSDDSNKDFVSDVLESLILSSCIGNLTPRAIKICLRSAVKLCEACPDRCNKFVYTVTNILSSVHSTSCLLLCEFLMAIGSRHYQPVQSVLAELISTLNTSTDPRIKVALATVIFQASVDSNSETVSSHVSSLYGALDGWSLFKVGRQAAHYGHHGVAAVIWGKVSGQVCSENFQNWLRALKEISLGEQSLHDKDITQAIMYYQQGMTSLKSSCSPSHQLLFQGEFIKLRVMTLLAHSQVNRVCKSFDTNPPPAIASSLALATQNDLFKCGHVVTQLQECLSQFQEVSSFYGKLYRTLFDADPETLKNILILQESCNIMAKTIEKVFNSKTESSGSVEMSAVTREVDDSHWSAIDRIQEESSRLLHQACQMSSHLPLNYMHIECIQKTSEMLVRQPLHFPRLFFQSLQETSIKLAISPPSKPNDPYTIERATRLALKVEGIILHGARPGLFRGVKNVSVNVSSVLVSRLPMPKDAKVPECQRNEMSQAATPHNDYFAAQFLLHFPAPGYYTINIHTCIVDETGATWQSGPGTTLNIKSYDEVARVQAHQQQAQSRSFALTQQRAGSTMA